MARLSLAVVAVVPASWHASCRRRAARPHKRGRHATAVSSGKKARSALLFQCAQQPVHACKQAKGSMSRGPGGNNQKLGPRGRYQLSVYVVLSERSMGTSTNRSIDGHGQAIVQLASRYILVGVASCGGDWCVGLGPGGRAMHATHIYAYNTHTMHAWHHATGSCWSLLHQPTTRTSCHGKQTTTTTCTQRNDDRPKQKQKPLPTTTWASGGPSLDGDMPACLAASTT